MNSLKTKRLLTVPRNIKFPIELLRRKVKFKEKFVAKVKVESLRLHKKYIASLRTDGF